MPTRDAGNFNTAANNLNRTGTGTHPNLYSTKGTPAYGITTQVANFGTWNGTDGLWTPPYPCGTHTLISKGNVKINSYYLDLPNYPQAVDISLITHELGHAEGLGHQTSDPCHLPAVMNPYTSTRRQCNWNTPTADDAMGLRVAYS
ncbi:MULTISPECIES: hypothetical protein [unclassified Luteococcus]|uniref:hypothetical protein n=1 Tax=unclassified Luteococcus TaxID=2639923 RepID=UPI00313DF455